MFLVRRSAWFMKNVYLVGMMGSGKTSSGRALARLLALPFVDLDDDITERDGHSINDIFESKGEPYFRTLERELLLQVSRKTDQVIATGGGIVLDPANRLRMRETGHVIYLKTGLPVLWDRVKEKKDRPLLSGPDREQALAGLFYARTPLYESSSDKVFLTDQKSPEAVALEIYKACFEKR
mgnify:CR=1 FL=1